MKIRLVLAFALLLCIALMRPGSVFGSDAEEALSQATPITPTVLAVVRNQGTALHDRPNGEPFHSLVGGTLVTARLRSQDNRWVLVETRDETAGWVEIRTLLAAGLSRLPVEQPTATPTSTPEPTTEADSTTMTEATGTATAEPVSQEDAMPTPTPSETPEESMDSMTPEATGETMEEGATPESSEEAMAESGTPEATEEAMAESGTPEATEEAMAESGTPEATEEAMAESGTPQPTAEATIEPTREATPEPSPTPFVPPEGPTALALARVGGANLWRNEDGAFVAHFEAGQRLTAAYRTEESDWYFVYDDDGDHGWVSDDELLVVNPDSLPVDEFVSSPTSETELVDDSDKVVVTVNTVGLRLNVRGGPGTEYEIVAKAVTGVEFNAIGRNEDSSWVQVAIADLPSGYGWVSADFVTVEGALEQLPVVVEAETSEEGSSPPPVFSLPLAIHSLKPSTTTMA